MREGIMSREEAAAKAAMQRDSCNEDWPTQDEINAPGSCWQHVSPELLRELYAEECRPVLEAADAHDAANGVRRVTLNEATMERGVKGLRDEFSVDDAVGEYYATAVWGTPEDIVRAVLEAAVKEGQ